MLRRLALGAAMLLGLLFATGSPASAQAVSGKVAATVPPNSNTSPPTCFYFTIGASGYYSISQSAPGYSETVAIILLAASTGQTLWVLPSGTLACGLSGITTAWIVWPP